jgi:hypothetical protein
MVLPDYVIKIMPDSILKRPKITHLVAFDTASSKLFLIAGGTVDFLLTRDEALGAYGSFAYTATEAFLMPLTCLVLHLLCACYTNKITTSDKCHVPGEQNFASQADTMYMSGHIVYEISTYVSE